MLERDGFITTESIRSLKKRRVFAHERWRELRDRIAALSAHFNTADRAVRL